MLYNDIINYFYPEDNPLRQLLLHHSRQVADKALSIASGHCDWDIDCNLLEEAAMLHDIGIRECNAPGIYCFGTRPYIEHGKVGAEMIRNLPSSLLSSLSSLESIARVCERHTGTGLPGYEPETLGEQIICFADKFFSKSSPNKEKTKEEACRSLMKFGEEGVEKFKCWCDKFLT